MEFKRPPAPEPVGVRRHVRSFGEQTNPRIGDFQEELQPEHEVAYYTTNCGHVLARRHEVHGHRHQSLPNVLTTLRQLPAAPTRPYSAVALIDTCIADVDPEGCRIFRHKLKGSTAKTQTILETVRQVGSRDA